MKLHILALPNTQVNDAFLTCAYTQKIAKFAKMMGGEHDIILYANEGVSEGVADYCSEVVTILFEEERRGWFGEGFDTAETPFNWDASEPYWKLSNARAAGAVMEREEPGDLLLLSTSVQMPVARAATSCRVLEPFVGYEGVQADFCAFESYAWMHHVYGIKGWRNGRAFDAVIPNYFDPADFPSGGSGAGEYLLFMGRCVNRKGPHVAADIAARAGRKLIIAGPGCTQKRDGLYTVEGLRIGKPGADVDYWGVAGKEDRATLMRDAAAMIVPTLYVEPFGGVAAEAMMAGCPVIGSDFGAFTEYLPKQCRFKTIKQGEAALAYALDTEREWWRHEGYTRFALNNVRPQFDAWFDSLATLAKGGYYD